MTSQFSLDRRRMLAGLAMGMGGSALAACGGRAGAQAAACAATPTETRGPFPADGSNGGPRPVNVLAMDGVVRQDIRASFAGLEGQATGIPLDLEVRLARAADCVPLAGHAIYLWQNDAAGGYSLYDLPRSNYLRGIQAADADGLVRFTAIVPGCYGGRYPHCHFEVFASIESALKGGPPLLVSQLAFPASECRAVYAADGRYGDSLRNLERVSIERDFVFGDTRAQGQTVALEGTPALGYAGRARVVLPG